MKFTRVYTRPHEIRAHEIRAHGDILIESSVYTRSHDIHTNGAMLSEAIWSQSVGKMTRGPADAVTDVDGLTEDLRTYTRDVDIENLWNFRRYNNAELDKHKSPAAQDLVANHALFKVLLSYFPSGRMKDSIVKQAIRRILETQKWVNTFKDIDSDVFIEWLCKRLHTQLTHLHDCKLYPRRIASRVAALNEAQMAQFQELMSIMTDPRLATPSRKRSATSLSDHDAVTASSSSSIPMIFLAPPLLEDTVDADPVAGIPGPVGAAPVAGIPGIFATPPKTKKVKSREELTREAASTPPLPAGRGEIRALMRGPDTHDKKRRSRLECSAGCIKIERALTGHVRTYIRVNKFLWVGLTERQHGDHAKIIQHVAQMIAKHDLDKASTVDLRDRMLVSWPSIPEI